MPPAIHWFGGRPFAAFVALALLTLIVAGGNPADYAFLSRRSNFVHLIALDLLVLVLLFPALLRRPAERVD